MSWFGKLQLIVAFGLLTACGPTTANTPPVSSPQADTKALEAAGWRVTIANGMPQTYSGAKQVAFLELISPDKVHVDAQFLGSANEATNEASQARKHGYRAIAIGSAIIFSHPSGSADLSAPVQVSLRRLLTH